MTTSTQHTELKAFLRARRSALSPDAVGLPRGQRRRTPGLRREEVAALADVGVTWYTWLEQGRDINVSAAVIARVAAALRLTPTEEAYLCMLVGVAHPQTIDAEAQLPAAIHDMLELYAAPAMVFDRLLNMLACNRMARRLFDVDECTGRYAANHVWNAFMNPARRRLYHDNYDAATRMMLSALRVNQAAYPDDTRFGELIATLTATSAEFAAAWLQIHVEEPVSVTLSDTTVPLAMKFVHTEFGAVRMHFVHMHIRGARNNGTVISQLVPTDPETAASFARMAQRLCSEAAIV